MDFTAYHLLCAKHLLSNYIFCNFSLQDMLRNASSSLDMETVALRSLTENLKKKPFHFATLDMYGYGLSSVYLGPMNVDNFRYLQTRSHMIWRHKTMSHKTEDTQILFFFRSANVLKRRIKYLEGNVS